MVEPAENTGMVKKWIKQITDRVQGKDELAESDPAAPQVSAEQPTAVLEPIKETPALAEPEVPGALGRWMQRKATTPGLESCLEQLVATNEKLTAALEKIQQSSQSDGSQFDSLARNQDRFVSLLDRQGKILEQMLGEVQRLTTTTDRLVGALEAVPKSSREQAEKLSAIEDQLATDGQTDRALLGTMDTLGRNVASLARYAEAQQSYREDFAKNLAQQVEPLVTLLERLTRSSKSLLTLLVVIAVILLVLAGVHLVKPF